MKTFASLLVRSFLTNIQICPCAMRMWAQAFASNPSQGRWWAALFPRLSAGSGASSGGPQDPPATATAAWSAVPRFFGGYRASPATHWYVPYGGRLLSSGSPAGP